MYSDYVFGLWIRVMYAVIYTEDNRTECNCTQWQI